jgi:acetate kinase
MTSAMPCVLAVNGGSSSIKFALFEFGDNNRQLLSGKIEGIGLPSSRFVVQGVQADDHIDRSPSSLSYATAIDQLTRWMTARLQHGALLAIGHRIVNGGGQQRQPQVITQQLLQQLREASAFDPEHLPQELQLIDAIDAAFPALMQIACFDTTFHDTMPDVARRLPLPRRYHEQGVRRYGFHGLSCTYVMQQLMTLQPDAASRARVIIAHLGNGASVTAVKDGHSVDTSMSFSPCGGLVMGSRTGDLDPGLAFYFAQHEQMNAQQFHHMVNHASGLLGISEISSDMRALLSKEADETRAAEAVAMFCYQAKKWICALAGAMGGIDTLVFTGGIGENLPQIRARICNDLGFIGIELHQDDNDRNAPLISNARSKVAVHVIRTDEEQVIAHAAFAIAKNAHQG